MRVFKIVKVCSGCQTALSLVRSGKQIANKILALGIDTIFEEVKPCQECGQPVYTRQVLRGMDLVHLEVIWDAQKNSRKTLRLLCKGHINGIDEYLNVKVVDADQVAVVPKKRRNFAAKLEAQKIDDTYHLRNPAHPGKRKSIGKVVNTSIIGKRQ